MWFQTTEPVQAGVMLQLEITNKKPCLAPWDRLSLRGFWVIWRSLSTLIPTPSPQEPISLGRPAKSMGWQSSCIPSWLWSKIMVLLPASRDFPFVLLSFPLSWVYLFERKCKVQFLFKLPRLLILRKSKKIWHTNLRLPMHLRKLYF